MGQNIMSQDIMEQDIIGQNISKELVAQWSEDFRRLTGGRSPVGNSLSRAGLRTVAMNPQAFRENPRVFSQELPAGPAQDQRKSGRCWIFAGLNFLRQKAVEKHGLKDIVFSASYLSFWSNLEKSNYVLEIILETRDDDLEDPVVRWILANPLNDGGQWEMLCDLIDKYGAAPESAMPENYQSGDSRDMTRCIITKLRQSACLLRRQSRQGASLAELRRQKAAFLREIYGMLCFFLGEPPQQFDKE
ncbi:MAG: hypothetical protein LBK98_10465 [Peptococcaceae bacterium]|jgi:bleomycin hydrolase|nr:hypothetical protein [Peptococcaceae bacterium]